MATETVVPPVVVEPEKVIPPNGQALTKAKPERIQVHFDADDPVSLYMDTGIFEQLQRVATLMSRSGLVPMHLRGEDKVSDCFLVTAQAFRWRMDPFSVAQHTFVLKGKLGYEGKLIAGVINASGKLAGNLSYRYAGEGKERAVTVVGTLKGESQERTVEGTVAQWSTDNEMWRKDPDQILAYRGAREWARRHMPEAVLGIQAEEELGPTVELNPRADGTYASRRDVPTVADPLLESIGIAIPPGEGFVLAPPSPPVEPTKDCKHPSVPPSKLAGGKTLVCLECGEELKGE